MQCDGCGAELAEGAKTCTACGREVNLAQKTAQESLHVAKVTEAAAEKVGKGLWGGVKAVGSSTKKGFKRLEEEGKKD